MKRQQSGEEKMGEKLNRIVAPETTGLWQQMKSLLEEALPQRTNLLSLQQSATDQEITNPGLQQAPTVPFRLYH